jgi:hypothetical protein
MILAAMGLFVVGYYWGNRYQYSGDPPVIEGVLLRPPVMLPDFELRDADGLPFTRNDLADRWTLLAFGELHRADGHLAVNRMIGVYNRLTDQPELREQLQLALASEQQELGLSRDFSRLSSALKVLSGDAAELDRVRASAGNTPGRGPATGELGTPFYLIDPKTRLMVVFTEAQKPEAIAEDISALAARPDLLETPDE